MEKIENITLNPSLLDFIDRMQNDENCGFEIIRNDLAEAVCFLGGMISQLRPGKERDEAYKHIETLSIIREDLDVFRK
jgi:hypothetical protein